ncbi:hypothetical protein KCU88_g150, partial [Aureobasidium melanogenum]
MEARVKTPQGVRAVRYYCDHHRRHGRRDINLRTEDDGEVGVVVVLLVMDPTNEPGRWAGRVVRRRALTVFDLAAVFSPVEEDWTRLGFSGYSAHSGLLRAAMAFVSVAGSTENRLSNVALAQPSGRTSINQVLIEDLEFTEDSGIYHLLEGFILEVVRRPAAVLVNVELLEKRAELDQMVPGCFEKVGDRLIPLDLVLTSCKLVLDVERLRQEKGCKSMVNTLSEVKGILCAIAGAVHINPRFQIYQGPSQGPTRQWSVVEPGKEIPSSDMMVEDFLEPGARSRRESNPLTLRNASPVGQQSSGSC